MKALVSPCVDVSDTCGLHLEGNTVNSRDSRASSCDSEKPSSDNKKVFPSFYSLCKTALFHPSVAGLSIHEAQRIWSSVFRFCWLCTMSVGLCLNPVLSHPLIFLLLQGEYFQTQDMLNTDCLKEIPKGKIA